MPAMLLAKRVATQFSARGVDMGDVAKGTPWGPMQSGRPDDYQVATDPNQFGSFDTSPLAARLNNDLALQGGNAQRQALAGASKAYGSGTQSGSTMGKLNNIAANTERNQGDLSAKLAMQEYMDKEGRMDAYNKAKQAKFNAENGIFGQENSDRGKADAELGKSVGSIIGSIWGKK